MSESSTLGAYSPEQSALLRERTDVLLRILRGDAPALALDALLSAYATVAVAFGRAPQAAHLLRVFSGILESHGTPDKFQKAVDSVPREVLNVPMPERPQGPLPHGYAPDDVARIEALVRSILDLMEGEKGHNGLSALITCYAQIADHVGDTPTAARVLLETGARMLGTPQPVAAAGEPVPAMSPKLH